MKKQKFNVLFLLNGLYVLITGVVNLYGYFHLPDVMATQFSLSGESVNHMSTPIYLMIAFVIVLLLSIFCYRNEKEQKIKYFIINTIIFIANIVMIVIQL